MNKRQTVKKQIMMRRILVLTVFVLLAILLALLLSLIFKKRNTKPTGFVVPSGSPSSSQSIDLTSPQASIQPLETIDPFKTDDPIILPSVDPTSSDQPEITIDPNVNNIQRVVTSGTLNDTLARLEQIKTLPDSEKVILLDVGHGGIDVGTSGSETGVTEAKLNLEVATYVAQELGDKGYYVFMTRMGDYAVARSKNEDMKLRKRIMKLPVFDCSISIHMNAYAGDDSVKGVRLYHYKNGTEGEKLARLILNSICELTGETRRSTSTGNLMVVREPIMPSALIECGFLTNREDEMKLQDPEYQKLLAKAIAQGVDNYMKNK